MTDPSYCDAEGRSGNPCKRPAGWGTEHVGIGRCKLHGGNTPTHVAAAQREQAKAAVVTLGLPREVAPHQALLEEVYRAAGHVQWLGDVVAGLEKDRLVSGVSKTVQLPNGDRRVEVEAAVNVWVRLYHDERDRLVRVADTAIRAGVAERQVKLAEQQAERLAAAVSAILIDLGHDLADSKVREVVRLRLIEGGADAAAA